MKTKAKEFLLLLLFDFEFPALEVPPSFTIQKGGIISKLIFVFITLSYSTLICYIQKYVMLNSTNAVEMEIVLMENVNATLVGVLNQIVVVKIQV